VEKEWKSTRDYNKNNTKRDKNYDTIQYKVYNNKKTAKHKKKKNNNIN
jgi:hypothetical protein